MRYERAVVRDSQSIYTVVRSLAAMAWLQHNRPLNPYRGIKFTGLNSPTSNVEAMHYAEGSNSVKESELVPQMLEEEEHQVLQRL